MGNCTSSEVAKTQAFNAKREKQTRPAPGQLKELLDAKKDKGAKEVSDEGIQKVEEVAKELGDANVDAAVGATDAIGEAPLEVARDALEEAQEAGRAAAADDGRADAAVLGESDSARLQMIAALRRVSPSSSPHGLSLLRVAGEEPAAVDAAADAVAADVRKERPSELLLPEAEAEEGTVEGVVQAAGSTTQRAECDSPTSPMSPSSPASWVPDESTKVCQCCEASFTFRRRRHHCRACGQVVCSGCSASRVVLPDMGHSTPVRCCDRCLDVER